MDTLKNPIPQSVLDSIDDYIANKIALVGFNDTNVASGSDSATLNKTSGTVTFSTPVAAYPSHTQYAIYNNLVTTASIVQVFVYTNSEDNYIVNNGIYIGAGQIIVNLNDGGLSNPCPPIIAFQILNP